MKYYLIAGEASGDLHGANLIKAISAEDESAEFRFWGGERMAECSGNSPVVHYRNMAFMGFWEVVRNLRTIASFLKKCKEDLLRYRPDVLVLIDYPGFNMRMAAFAKANGIKVAYYIAPQVWAWKKNRVFKLKKTVDELISILPFEKEFFAGFGMEVQYVGHPLLDAIGDKGDWTKQAEAEWLEGPPIIALLPGSRKQEVETILPIMLSVRKDFPEYRWKVAQAPSLPVEFYQSLLKGMDVELVADKTYPLLSVAHAALVTSGTATLETALFGVPEVVCYKGSAISYRIARALVKIRFISLVNLIVNREMVKELIQQDLTADQLRANLQSILEESSRARLNEGYQELQKTLGGGGASKRAARLVSALAERV